MSNLVTYIPGFIRASTLGEIGKKRMQVRDHPEFSDSVRTQWVEQQIRFANEQSCLIEEDSQASKQKKAERRERVRCVCDNITQAWDFASDAYLGSWNHELIRDIALRLEPETLEPEISRRSMRTTNPYRDGAVRSFTLNDVPLVHPNPKSVFSSMVNLVDILNMKEIPAMERAALAHVYISLVQPFEDGNKRLSRMVSNLLLCGEGYSPVVIEAGEREFYTGLLYDAMLEARDKEPYEYERPALSLFGNWLASKENSSLDALTAELQTKRKYQVSMEPSEKGFLMGATRMLQNYFRTRHPNTYHRVQRREGEGLIVTGNVAEDQLQHLLLGYSKHLKNLNITPVTNGE